MELPALGIERPVNIDKNSFFVFHKESLIFNLVELDQQLGGVDHGLGTVPIAEIVDGSGVFDQITETAESNLSLENSTCFQEFHQDI